MKKWTIPILLLFVMILSLTAVSAAEEISLDLGDSQDIEVQSTPASVTNAEDQGVLKAPENTEVLSDPETKNFTTLQTEIDEADVDLELGSNYVRADGENDIVISKNMWIDGKNQYKIDANGLGGIFRINEGCTLTLQDIILVNANANYDGGAVYVSEGAKFRIMDSEIANSTALSGGAIYNKGTATVTGTTLSGNNATNWGGAIYSEGKLTVQSSEFDDNEAQGSGGAIFNIGEATVKDSDFENNAGLGSSIMNFYGTLALANVNADPRGIHNERGTITSKVYVTILDNGTATVDDFVVVVNATVKDENENEIIDDSLMFFTDGDAVAAEYNDTLGCYQGVLTLPTGGIYTVDAVSETGSAIEVKTATIKCTIGTFTDLQAQIDAAIAEDVTLNLPYDFTYIPEIDGEVYRNGIKINESIIIVGNGNTIDANGANNIFRITSGEVYLDTIAFTNAAVNAIAIGDNSTVNIANSVFEDNIADSNGGAILNHGTLFIFNCDFINNTASNGGAIASDGNLTIDKAVFIDNEATTRGAAIYAEGNLTVTESTFTDNVAGNCAVYISGNSVASIENSEFTGNIATGGTTGYGGAITVGRSGYLTVKGSKFVNNTAGYGNAIYVAANAYLGLNDSNFTGNGGSDEAAIRARPRANIELSGNDIDNFIYNEGNFLSNATAVVMDNKTVIPDSDEVVITAIVYDDNWNRIIDSSFKFVVIPGSTIDAEFNETDSLYYANFTLPSDMGVLYTVNMTSAKYEKLNVETGAFYTVKGTYTDLQMKIDDFVDSGDVLVLPYNFAYNEDVDDEDLFSQGVVIYGAVIINGNGYTIDGNDKKRIFYIAEGGSLTIYNATLTNGNDSDYGGAIFMDEDAYLDANNIVFIENTAGFGGAIFAIEGSNIVINNSEFTDNIADAGGAIYVDGVDSLIIDNSEFTGNLAIGDAAIDVCSVYNVVINSTSFEDNSGAVYIDEDSIATIEGSTFIANGEYPIYNDGELSLSENDLEDDGLIYNNGVITSTVYAEVMDNDTYITLDATFPINATLTDDSGNLIYDPNFKFTANGEAIEDADYDFATDLYNSTLIIGFEATYVISVDDTNYTDLNVLVGIVKNGNVGTYTDLQAQINAAIERGDETFTLPYNFTYFEAIDGGKFNSGIILTAPITIIGDNNYIDGAGKVRAFDVEVDNVALVGIEFRNGRAPNGGAVYTRSDLSIENCTFINNTADVGNAIYAVALLDVVPKISIKDSTFTDNGAYDDFAIYNNNTDMYLTNNFLSNVIFNNGTIDGLIVILNEEVINATFGQTITLNATFVDDSGNFIFDPNFVFLVEDVGPIEFTDFDAELGLYSVTYVADTLGLLEVNSNIDYDFVDVYTGFLDISKANVTLTVSAEDIVRKQNETISVSLYDLFGNPLNLTVNVYLYDANDVLIDTHIENTVNGVFSYNIAINETGVYKVNAIFSSYGYELTSNVSSFFVDEYVIPGSYMDLQRKIDHAIYRGETTFVLPYDFSYIADCDEDFFPDGVVINAPITIDGNMSSISGNGSYAIFYINASDVNITNVIFKDGYSMNGGAIYVSDEADNVAISSSIFTNNTAAWGGAIAWDGDNGIIDNCWFINNEASIPELTANAGGAIIWGGADGKITSSGILGTVFMNNTAVQGGAIFVEGDNFTIEQAGFIMNSAIAGGAIFWYADDGLINDSTFYANNATNGGGAIAWMGEFGLINASRFIQNNAISVGGAIVSNSSLLIVQSTDFTNNTAEYGGAIFTFNDLFVADSEFAGNTAEVANAIGVADGTLLLLNNTINTEAADVVVGDEGKIGSYVNVTILDNSTLDIVEDTYILYAKITDDRGNLIEAEGFEFVINDEETVPATYNATTGLYEYVFEIPDEPAVYYVNMTYIETEMLDTHIGILRYIRGTYTDLQNRILDTEENGTLELPYNFAYTESIDGMAFQFGVIIFQPINIEGNDYVISGSDSYRIFLIGASNVNITDVVFANGNATDDESLGGAILVAGNAENVTIADSLFVNNTAAYGGAIFFVGENGVVDGVWFINNTAENKGGAIYWKGNYGLISGISMDEDPLLTEMTLFINNTAGEKGGAIHVVGNNFTIENSGFMGNNATDGGAVSVVGSDVSIDHNMFIYNNATYGGAVHITEDAERIIIDDSLFYANNATEVGGAIYSEGKDLYVFDTHFYQNGALYGGAITTFNRTAIINSTFALNEAEYYGGAIYANDMLGVAESKFEDNTAMFGNAILMGEGDLYLSENEINTEAADVVLTYNSAIDSDVIVTVLGNTTVEIFGFDAILNATVTDDMGNLIEAPYFKFIINDEEIDAVYNNETNLYEAEYTLPEISVYPVDMTYINTENLDVYIGIISNLKTGTYTDLQRRIDIAIANGEDLVLPYNFTYNEAIDGDDFPIGVVIWDDLNIDANGFTISANNSDVNILTIDEGCEVTIENAIITGVNGSTISFGAVANHGDLTLNNCTIIDNTITKASYGVGGAAIYNDGTNLVINGSYIINNTAPFEGSFAAVLIKESGTVVINNTVLADNSANLGGAIHVMLNQDPVIIYNSVFDNNVAFEGQDILSDSEVAIFDSNFTGDRGEDIPPSIVNMGSLYLFRNYVEGAVYNSAEGTLYLDSNEVTYCIVNYGTIATLTNATFLDNNTIPAQLGDSVLAYGTLTDDNGNFIWDERFNITIGDEVFSGEDLFIDVEGKIYYVNYTIEYAGLNVVSTTYDATVINIGIFDVPKANVTEFVVVVGGQDNRIPYGENATVYVSLLGIDGIGLNETITVVVNDVPYLIDVIDGEAQFNVSGLEPGDYSATGMLINNRNYNDAYATGLFTILEPEAILTIEVEDTTFGEDLMVTVRFTDADGEPLPGYVTVTIEEWEDVIGLYGETTFYAPGLAVGNYTAYVRFDGDERYGSLSNNTTFQVTRIVDYDFIAEAEITPFDEQPVWVYIELPDFATGNVTITINGTTFNATVEDGEAIIVIDDFLDIGDYLDVEVAYSGDDIYAPGTTTVDIVVIPIDPELEAELEFTMIAYLDNATIYAFVNLGATGNILVYDHITEELLANVTVEEAEEGINIAGLSAGTYFFDVIYTGDDYYYADAVYELELEVIKIYPELSIEVTGDLVVDGEVNITFTTPEDADGFVSIYVDGKKVEYTGENGTYTVTINNFAAGTHTVMGVLEWDTNYDDDYVVDTFEIEKIDPELEINVTGEAVADGSVTITIILPEDAEGFVLIDINDKSTYAVPEDGIVTVEIDDLAATIYEISVTYTGDDKYEEDWNFAIIDVAKANSTIEIYGPDEADVGEDFIVYVFVDPETVTGNYSIFIDGVDVTSEYDDTTLIGGEGAFIVSGLAAGNHTIGVQYNGDENYNASVVAEYTVEVNRVNTTALIEVIGDEIEYGDVATVVVILPEDATGTVRVIANGKYLFADVIEGVAIVNITDLEVGEYEFDVGYKGDGKYDGYDGFVNVTVTVADPELLVVLEDGFIEYGEFTYLEIYLNESATGYVAIYAMDYATGEEVMLYNITVEEAREGVLIEELPAGEYIISAVYSGDNNFAEDYDYDTLYIIRTAPELEINVTGDLVVDGEVNITFYTPEDVDGLITILVDGYEVEYTGANGTYTVTMNNFAAGTHTVIGYLEGDSNYEDSSVVETFYIDKVDPTFSMLVEDIHVGDDEIIVFVLPEDATGYVVLEIGDMQSYAKVNEGVAVATISGLAEGNYTVVATYTGDDKYNTADTSGDFEVTKVSEYNMTVDPSSDDGNITVDVTLPEDATGTVTVTINGTEYNTTVENGNANVRVDNLPPGETNVTVSYTGDNKYDPKETSVIVNNTKKDVILTADVLEMYVGDGSKFTALLTDTAGNPIPNAGIKITINGKTYTYKTNSEGIAALPINLKCGSYPVYACFEGDDTYNPSENVSSRIEVYTSLRIVENKDLVKTQGGPEKFTVRALDQYGKPAGANEEVTMIINGVSYIMRTNADGYASLPINLRAGKYAITCMYGGTTVVNTIWVNAK